MLKRLSYLITSSLTAVAVLAAPVAVQAAEFYSGDTFTSTQDTRLNNAYIAAGNITVTTPAERDLTVVGGTITIDSNIEQSLHAAGGTVSVEGRVGQNARIAGGTITIRGEVIQDLVIFGGSVTVTQEATIRGDVVVAGGTIDIHGTIEGNLTASGGQVTFNGSANDINIDQVDTLIIGSEAEINGDLAYTSPREAQLHQDAVVRGDVNFTPESQTESATAALATTGFFYHILASLIFGIFLLYGLRRIASQGTKDTQDNPALTFGLGLIGVLLTPVIGIIAALLSPWLGAVILLLYVVLLITGFFLGQLILGWWLLSWWFGRNQQSYALDWRAIVIGVLTAAILSIVPVFGWLVLATVALFGFGSLLRNLWRLHKLDRPAPPAASTPSAKTNDNPPSTPKVVAESRAPKSTTTSAKRASARPAKPSATKAKAKP